MKHRAYNAYMLNELELTGRARTHVVQRDDLKAAIHADALELSSASGTPSIAASGRFMTRTVAYGTTHL
jgi:hypothetical protein